ncbi:MAG: hypothetical protein IIX19_03650 [Alistipes sp.]|nr:hypothetical protein [Alistipes sp.]
MRVKNIKERVARLATLVDGWKNEDSVPRIERDLALDELRRLYDALLDTEHGEGEEQASAEQEEEPMPEHKAEEAHVSVAKAEMVHDPIADFDDALDIDALLGITEEEKPQLVAEPEPVVEPVVEQPVEAPAPEPVEAPAPAKGGGLFDIDDIPVRTKTSRKMISLYNAPTKAASEPEQHRESVASMVMESKLQSQPQSQPHPVAQPMAEPQRVGDVLGSGKKVVGDMKNMDSMPTPPMSKITDLRKAIGLNDKFIMLRDLFAGNEEHYNTTIDMLNSFEDLDDCMIYIVENFTWNPDSEGAKLIVSLIERKLS